MNKFLCAVLLVISFGSTELSASSVISIQPINWTGSNLVQPSSWADPISINKFLDEGSGCLTLNGSLPFDGSLIFTSTKFECLSLNRDLFSVGSLTSLRPYEASIFLSVMPPLFLPVMPPVFFKNAFPDFYLPLWQNFTESQRIGPQPFDLASGVNACNGSLFLGSIGSFETHYSNLRPNLGTDLSGGNRLYKLDGGALPAAGMLSVIPEPTTVMMFGVGGLLVFAVRRLARR